MKSELFADLLASANEALDHAKGKRSLKTVSLPRLAEAMGPSEVRQVRESLQASQAVFALYLNVSTKLVQAWEASRRQPEGPALVLLHMLKKQPGLVDTLLSGKTVAEKARRNGRTGRRKRMTLAHK